MVAIKDTEKVAVDNLKIPDFLIRDMIDGVPYYYKGYQDVLNQTKTFEDIMPCSTLQAEIIMYLNFLLIQTLGIQKFRVFASESGNHLAKNVNYGLDLAVYDKQILTADKINQKYANVPPELVVEVDVKVALETESEMDFIIKKTQSLLDYGAKTVIWVTSKNKKVIIAQPNQDWIIKDWSKDFTLMNGIVANIGEYLEENGIEVVN